MRNLQTILNLTWIGLSLKELVFHRLYNNYKINKLFNAQNICFSMRWFSDASIRNDDYFLCNCKNKLFNLNFSEKCTKSNDAKVICVLIHAKHYLQNNKNQFNEEKCFQSLKSLESDFNHSDRRCVYANKYDQNHTHMVLYITYIIKMVFNLQMFKKMLLGQLWSEENGNIPWSKRDRNAIT